MNDAAQQLYSSVTELHTTIYKSLLQIKYATPKRADIEDDTDNIYVLNMCLKAIDDIKKEMNKLSTQLKRQVCAIWAQQMTGEPIRTKYCTGTPRIKQTASIPKQGTEEYAELCQFFHVPATAPFRPHWPTMVEAISMEIASGRPLPPGVDPAKVTSVMEVTTRKRSNAPDIEPNGPLGVSQALSLIDEQHTTRVIDAVALVVETAMAVNESLSIVSLINELAIESMIDKLNTIDDTPVVISMSNDEENPF